MEKEKGKEEKIVHGNKSGRSLRIVGKEEVTEDFNKCILLITPNKCIVGEPKYGEVKDETGEFIVVCLEIRNAVEFYPVIIPITDREGQQQAALQFMPLKLGTVVDISDMAVMVELANDSPYYMQYVKITTGVALVAPGSGPMSRLPR